MSHKTFNTSLTIVMPYFNNGDMLQKHFEIWRQYPSDVKQNIEAIIVDATGAGIR